MRSPLLVVGLAMLLSGCPSLPGHYGTLTPPPASQQRIPNRWGMFGLGGDYTLSDAFVAGHFHVYFLDAGTNLVQLGPDAAVNAALTPIAKLEGPGHALAVDGTGAVFAADPTANKIVKVMPDGKVSRLPGSGAKDVRGLAVGSDGTLYVAEADTHRIVRLSPDGTVDVLAGASNEPGYVDGTGVTARFNQPSGLALGSNGVLFVADAGNARIRRISSDGVVSTLAGGGPEDTSADPLKDGPATSARFPDVRSIAVDSADNVYVAEPDRHVVRMISGGTVSVVAGARNFCHDGTAGTRLDDCFFDGTDDQLTPTGVAVDSEGPLLFIADGKKRQVLKIK